MVSGLGLPNKLGIVVFARIAIKKPGLIGENNQRVCVNQICHQRGQRIIVAKANLIGSDRIVFVYDRDNAEFQQGGERAAGV